jgi:hypothetical protein
LHLTVLKVPESGNVILRFVGGVSHQESKTRATTADYLLFNPIRRTSDLSKDEIFLYA